MLNFDLNTIEPGGGRHVQLTTLIKPVNLKAAKARQPWIPWMLLDQLVVLDHFDPLWKPEVIPSLKLTACP